MFATEYPCLLIKGENDSLPIEHLGYTVYFININESLEYILECIN